MVVLCANIFSMIIVIIAIAIIMILIVITFVVIIVIVAICIVMTIVENPAHFRGTALSAARTKRGPDFSPRN